MGCCQSNNNELEITMERNEFDLNLMSETSSVNESNDTLEENLLASSLQMTHAHLKKAEFPGYENIIKGRKNHVQHNSNRLISGFIDVNIINTPKADFFQSYQIGKFLGQGGFGTVFVATQKVTKAKRAIKMVSKASLSSKDNLLLLQELAILKQIDHPNILKILEHYEDEQHHFLVTEHLSGGELFNKIVDIKNFDENKASDYMRQILSAVSYCHSQNIVHRDIKPENILFSSKKSDSQLKVIDFGCSTKFERQKKLKDIVGTVLYIAPEVIKKDEYDEKCDIWSIGIVLYIMLSGQPPFDGHNDDEVFDAIQNNPLSFEGEEWLKVSDEAKNLITLMLKKNPKERISAQDAYQHPWIQKRIKNQVLEESIMKNLASFSARNKVKTAILNMITLHVLTNKDKQEIIQNFQRLDKNGDGQLSRQELIDGYENIIGDRVQAEQVVDAVFNEIDYDGSGQVSFQEFLVASVNKEKMFSKRNLLKAFDLIDEDRNGFITKDELERLVGGSPINEAVWNKMMSECDVNGDGKLDKAEFVALLLKWLDRDLFRIEDADEMRTSSLMQVASLVQINSNIRANGDQSMHINNGSMSTLDRRFVILPRKQLGDSISPSQISSKSGMVINQAKNRQMFQSIQLADINRKQDGTNSGSSSKNPSQKPRSVSKNVYDSAMGNIRMQRPKQYQNNRPKELSSLGLQKESCDNSFGMPNSMTNSDIPLFQSFRLPSPTPSRKESVLPASKKNSIMQSNPSAS